jgi:hypothetical protein
VCRRRTRGAPRRRPGGRLLRRTAQPPRARPGRRGAKPPPRPPAAGVAAADGERGAVPAAGAHEEARERGERHRERRRPRVCGRERHRRAGMLERLHRARQELEGGTGRHVVDGLEAREHVERMPVQGAEPLRVRHSGVRLGRRLTPVDVLHEDDGRGLTPKLSCGVVRVQRRRSETAPRGAAGRPRIPRQLQRHVRPLQAPRAGCRRCGT